MAQSEEESGVVAGGKMGVGERLAKFRADRALKKALEKANKKQPFRVGVYKLDGKIKKKVIQKKFKITETFLRMYLGKFPPPSTEKAGAIPQAVRSAAFKGKRLRYTTPSNKNISNKSMPKGQFSICADI